MPASLEGGPRGTHRALAAQGQGTHPLPPAPRGTIWQPGSDPQRLPSTPPLGPRMLQLSTRPLVTISIYTSHSHRTKEGLPSLFPCSSPTSPHTTVY